MNAALPEYASAFVDRHGKTRIKLRRKGWVSTYLKADPGSPEFTVEYHTWKREGKIERRIGTVEPRSFDDLIGRFYQTTDWAKASPGTHKSYRSSLEQFRAIYGSWPADTMGARHVSIVLDKMTDRPGRANNLRKRLNQLFKLAIHLEWRKDNPVASVKGGKSSKTGFATWQEEQIELFEAYWPIGSMQRLAFDLALYTAQRRSDIRVLGPQHIEDGRIRVKQIKTQARLMIPIHPNLAKSIAATPTGHLAFLINPQGVPFAENGFGMWFLRSARKAGVHGYPLHGLRKAAARRMAEAGLSNQLIKSITGHTTDAEVSRYTRDAEQGAMADEAMRRMVLSTREKSSMSNLKQDIEKKA